ncbi:hypothetical protein [Actinosynnema pretiosum]|uniref:Cytoplasmic protein n=1 Tax=Actinosynnema pretiosum TaxID=42197 RepID=A0A290Z7R3_9PSEU|nr:hypothetical protein [Actinosynnema pretiosum]ATE55024.1 hypothetical protein CNX65_18465 [Actinosynnema pretiosum]
MTDFDALRSDGSWQLTTTGDRITGAVFRLAPNPDRRALVEALGADASDPEQWESVLLEAFLTAPESADLTVLELHLTDFHHSAARAAAALASRGREHLVELHLGHDFKLLYEHATTSTGRSFDPLEKLNEGFANESAVDLWSALPALRALTLRGGLLLDDMGSTTVTDLHVIGAPFAIGALFPDRAPGVVTLTAEIGYDVFGGVCPAGQLELLTPEGYPALRHLDISRAVFDEADEEVLETLAELPLLRQLETLDLELEEDVPERLAPAFAHLERGPEAG